MPFLALVGALLAPTAQAAVPSHNGKVAFERRVSPTNHDVFVTGGGATTNLTNRPGIDAEPAWSPDGTRIAFASDRAGNLDIWVMDADGANALQITTDPAADSEPAWSPDGTRLAFTSTRDGDEEIFTMDAAPEGAANVPHQLTFNTLAPVAEAGGQLVLRGHDHEPSWSPDGTRIAFASDRPPSAGNDVWVMNADGSGQTDITPGSRGSDRRPTWSPDGSKIAYATTSLAGDGVYLVDPAGGGLVNRGNLVSSDEEAAYAPDGRIYYSTAFNPAGDGIMWMFPSGRAPTHVTASPQDHWPDVQPCASCPGPPAEPPPPPAGAPAGSARAGSSPATAQAGGKGLVPDFHFATTPDGRLGTINARVVGLFGRNAIRVWQPDAHRARVVRLLGIARPVSRRCAKRSDRAVRSFLFDARGRGRVITFSTDRALPDRDKRGQILAYLRRGGRDLQLELLQKGWARVDTSAGRPSRLAAFRAAERLARRHHRGLWGRC